MKKKELKEEIQHIHNRINSLGDALISFCETVESIYKRTKALETKEEELKKTTDYLLEKCPSVATLKPLEGVTCKSYYDIREIPTAKKEDKKDE